MSESSFIFDASVENFQQGVIENSYKAPVIVDFWAEWCEPCKQLMPVLEKIVNEMQGKCVLAKVNSEQQTALAQQYQVRSIPTVMIFKNGEKVEQFTGVQPENILRELVEKHFITEVDIKRNKAIEELQAGNFASARSLLLEAEQLAPESATIQIDLAHIEARDKEYEAARNRLNQLKLIDREDPQVISLLNKIELKMATQNAPDIDVLLNTVEEKPEESLPRYQLAMQLINKGEHETGLQHLMYILQHDRTFQDDAAKKALISTFTLLGDENPLVGQYRRKMFNAMH